MTLKRSVLSGNIFTFTLKEQHGKNVELRIRDVNNESIEKFNQLNQMAINRTFFTQVVNITITVSGKDNAPVDTLMS